MADNAANRHKVLTEDIPGRLAEETHDAWTGEPRNAAKEPEFWAFDLRVRFDPPETETHALREKNNIITGLRRLGYDVEPMGLRERT